MKRPTKEEVRQAHMLLMTVNNATPIERLKAIQVIREATATTTNKTWKRN